MKLEILLKCFRDDATVAIFRGKARYQYITAKRFPQWLKNNMPYLKIDDMEVEVGNDSRVYYIEDLFGVKTKVELFKLIQQ